MHTMRLFSFAVLLVYWPSAIADASTAAAESTGPAHAARSADSDAALPAVKSFLEYFIDPGKSPRAQAALFAEDAEYYEHGQVGRNRIVQDVQRYSGRWPFRQYRLTAIHYISPDPASGRVFVSYEIAYRVANGSRQAAGTARYGAVIAGLSQAPRIEWIKERIGQGDGRD